MSNANTFEKLAEIDDGAAQRFKNTLASAGGDAENDRVINLEDIFKRLIHRFVVSRFQGRDSHTNTVWGRTVSSSCAAQSRSYYQDIFGDSCTVLTQMFLCTIVPFLARKDVHRACLPCGTIVQLADVTNYRGNYIDESVPMFGRISHDVLGGTYGNGKEWFVDISGAQFRGQNYPVVCWFYSRDALHASFQGRPLQSFRKLQGDDGIGGLSQLSSCNDDSVTNEIERLVNDDANLLLGCCEWCHGKGIHICSKCKSVSYCGSTCQKFHWRNGHKSKCQES